MTSVDQPPPINKTNLLFGIGLIAAVIGAVALGAGYLLGRAAADDAGDMGDMAMDAAPATGGELRQGVHEHQDFAVFVNGRQLSFADERFLSSVEKERSPSVHIHAPRTNVAHLHREQTTYDEFFLSFGMELTNSCLKLATGEQYCSDATNSLKFVVNGVRVDQLQFEKMTDLGRVLISYGPTAASLDQEVAAVTDEACIPGENCAERFPPGGIETEPCAKSAGVCH